jgi:hypothetical protein
MRHKRSSSSLPDISCIGDASCGSNSTEIMRFIFRELDVSSTDNANELELIRSRIHSSPINGGPSERFMDLIQDRQIGRDINAFV